MTLRHRSALFALVACAQAGACRTVHFGRAPDPRAVTLRADSSAYVVRVVGSTYRTDIGFTFTNHTGGTVSKAICGGPTPPTLEMEVSPGRWVIAYSEVELMCDRDPPFRVANEQSYRGTVDVVAAPHGVGGRLGLGWVADTVAGTYRLRWNLRGGADPHKASAPIIDAISPTFRLLTP